MLSPPTCAMAGYDEVGCHFSEVGDRVGDDRLEQAACEMEPTDEGVDVLEVGHSGDLARNRNRSVEQQRRAEFIDDLPTLAVEIVVARRGRRTSSPVGNTRLPDSAGTLASRDKHPASGIGPSSDATSRRADARKSPLRSNANDVDEGISARIEASPSSLLPE